jgi:RNA-splicing ligase RtcB
LGAEGYCSKHITDAFTYYQTPEGFIIPKSMLGDRELVIEFVDGEEAEELNRFIEEKQRIEEQKAQEKKVRRAEINRKIAEKKKKKKKDDRQLRLFD